MKVYDASVNLNKIRYDLSSIEHSFSKLSNQQILDKRWKNTDKALRMALPYIRRYYRQIADQVISLLKQIDFSYDKLNKPVTKTVRRIVEDKIEEYQEKGLVTGFFKYLISTNKWTYRSILEILLIGIYAEKFIQIKQVSYDVFTIAAVDVYSQSIADRKLKNYVLLSSAAIMAMAVMPVVGNTYDEYIESLIVTQAQETENYILVNAIQVITIDDGMLLEKIIKQANHILKINRDKYSGIVDDLSRSIGNDAYTYGTKKEDDLKIRFVAEMDNRTTRMCQSLNNQIFYVNKENTFRRYSASHKNYIEVTVNGLVQGVNLPPISDHFHWCRSTITYQI